MRGAMPSSSPVQPSRPARPGSAAMGALRAGAGLVTVASPQGRLHRQCAPPHGHHGAEADDAKVLPDLLADERKNAVLIGPGVGVGDHTKAMVRAALASKAAVVLDADALTSFASDRRRACSRPSPDGTLPSR